MQIDRERFTRLAARYPRPLRLSFRSAIGDIAANGHTTEWTPAASRFGELRIG